MTLNLRLLVWSGLGLLVPSLVLLLVLNRAAPVDHVSTFTVLAWLVTVLQFGGAGLLTGAAVLKVAGAPVERAAELQDRDWYE